MIALDAEVEAGIRDHGRRAYPEECCGVLLGRRDGAVPQATVVLPVANVHTEERRRRFLVAPRDYLAAERAAQERGLEVLGFYHSHPDHPPQPSRHDLLHAWPNLSYLILGVTAREPGELTAWRLVEDRSALRPERLVITAAAVLAAVQP